MKKKILLIISIILIILIVLGVVTNYIDSGRVTTNHEPKFCIKIVSNDGSKITYWGLGYKVIAYVSVSPNELYQSHIGVKMGSWFMKYVLEETPHLILTINDKTKDIDKKSDIDFIKNIFLNSKYNELPCDGKVSYIIKMDNQTYYLKSDCSALEKDNTQAILSESDLNKLLQIINYYGFVE